MKNIITTFLILLTIGLSAQTSDSTATHVILDGRIFNILGGWTAASIPIVDTGTIITATDVEGALQENRTAIDLNTAKVTNATHTGEVTGSTALTIAANAVETSNILDDEILEADLDFTNAAVDGYIITYDSASLGFTWEANTSTDDQTAAEVTYDNSGSGLSATDVQAAIDEVLDAGVNQITATTSRDAALTDANGIVDVLNASDVTITIPPNAEIAFDIGTILIYRRQGAGNVIISLDTGVVDEDSNTGTVGQTYAQAETISVWKTGVNTWELLDPPTTSGTGDVTKVGTPLDNQVGVWTGNGTIEGTTGLTYDGSTLAFTGGFTGTANSTISVDGSTAGNPRKIGFADLSATGEGASVEFGDAYNTIQSEFNYGMGIRSYNTMVIQGGSASATAMDFTDANWGNNGTESIRLLTNPNKSIIMHTTNADARTADYFKITNHSNTALSGVNSDGDLYTLDDAYAVGWNGNLEVPTKNAVYDKIETLAGAVTYREVIAISDNTTVLTTGTKMTWYSPPYAITITDAEASLLTAATGAGLILDIHDDGVTIMGTDKLDIDVSEFHTKDAATQPAISAGSIAASSKLEAIIDQVGSTVAGAGAVVYIYYTID